MEFTFAELLENEKNRLYGENIHIPVTLNLNFVVLEWKGVSESVPCVHGSITMNKF
jgi:hypothetical protein